jgi:hypothetical protein
MKKIVVLKKPRTKHIKDVGAEATVTCAVVRVSKIKFPKKDK